MKPAPFNYVEAHSVTEACSQLVTGKKNKCLGGGQSLGPMLNLRLARPDTLIDVHKLADLLIVEERNGSIFYGAAIRHAQFEDAQVPDAANGMLHHVAKDIAYRAVRNRGTLGGSLAHADPAADWVNVMAALDATLQLSSQNGKRQVKATDFFHAAFTTALANDEIISGVDVPRLSDEGRWGYYKFCRKQGEFSEATGVAVADPKRGYARVLVGALDGPPIALEGLADTLAEAGINASLEQAANIIDRHLPDYSSLRRQLYTAVVKRALAQLGGVTR